MNKIIPILTASGLSVLLLSGCESTLTEINPKDELALLKDQFNDYYTKVSAEISNYNVELDTDINIDENAELEEAEIDSEIDNDIVEKNQTETDDNEIVQEEKDEDDNTDVEKIETTEQDNNSKKECENCESSQISTLYSLSSDLNEACDSFCQLKNCLINAIVETNSLIEKIQTNNTDLTLEEKVLINEQATQLNVLSRNLNQITSELTLNLSDISEFFKDENGNIDTLSLKYLIALNNLNSGNQILGNGIYSLNYMNYLLNNPTYLPFNNGRLMYEYRKNNEPTIRKDLTIKDGEIIDNSTNNNDNITESVSGEANNENSEKKLFKSNIDTYGNTLNNIDTFFNTAWLDNNFMYGGRNGFYPMNPYGNGMGFNNAYNNNVNNYNNINDTTTDTINSVQNNNNTQNKETNPKKKFKLQKNIDTYRDENTPTVSAKLTVIKDSISDFFSNFKKNIDANEIKDQLKD